MASPTIQARAVLLAAACLVCLVSGAALAQGERPDRRLLIPREIVLYLHSSVDPSFVDPLLCKLERELETPISVARFAFPIDPSYRLNPAQLDAERLMAAFSGSVEAKSPSRTFRHFFIADDISQRGWNFFFATRAAPDRLGRSTQLISTARLRDGPLVDRLYKIILRGVVHAAGYASQGCVLAYNNDKPSFLQKDLELCPDDRAKLVQAGLIRREPRDCDVPVLVSSLTPPRPSGRPPGRS